ncbi:hypothetical protein D3C77_647210 [compost metagenome]
MDSGDLLNCLHVCVVLHQRVLDAIFPSSDDLQPAFRCFRVGNDLSLEALRFQDKDPVARHDDVVNLCRLSSYLASIDRVGEHLVFAAQT